LNGRVGVVKLDNDERVETGKHLKTEDDLEAGGDVPDDDQSFLLKDDVTAKEVEKMKIELESKINSYELSTGSDQPISEIEAAILSKLAGSVDELLASDVIDDDQAFDNDESEEAGNDQSLEDVSKDAGREESLVKDDEKDSVVNEKEEKDSVVNEKEVVMPKKKRTKNTNPLMKAVPVVKKSKAKFAASLKDVKSKIDEIEIPEVKAADLDYPDDPTFREGQPDGRVKRDGMEDEVVFGDKFRKYKNDKDGGFRKTGVEDSRE